MDGRKYEGLLVETTDRVTTVTLNRPEALNAVNAVVHRELSLIWPELDADPDTDVVVLQGAGRAFCAGGDLDWIKDVAGDPTAIIRGARIDRRITDEMLSLEKPVIAKVDGPAIGLGCSLALLCDFVFATERSVFADPHVAIGLVAGDGGALLWPQLVGYARARRYLLTGDPIKGREAADIGLITQVVADKAELDEVADAMVQRMRGGAKYAIQFTKASINAGLRQVANAVVDRAASYESITLMTEDIKIGVDALIARDNPVFKGM
jgi:enoyl-CoA hydratase